MRVFKGRKFEVLVERKSLPNGDETEIEFIHHRGSAVVVPMLSSEEVVVIRQYRPVVGKWLYEFPAGTVEEGESPVQTAIRELKEETGYNAEELQQLIAFYPSPGVSDELMYVFLARRLRVGESKPEKHELIEVNKLNINELYGMLNRGLLNDAKTILALFLLRSKM
ncbi:NUDIX hydrolase [Sulfodiicoccus acidiphilus]|uniref:NUDIX hydrolase n=1 Tax=Sulfodiicoccus acidiphilus TaxID=1670455 RepID=A0A348B0R4_9CREN|nr:NUDIX hydrolase [Sulfodiicoccus acidiphilus]BBD71766.1 NUDIX hydrolase [Sulfodiicoccus acidiphilus]GGT99089.1 NUDIX hydrolase [Sulfodiicoccus acidiphilus]